MNPSQNQRQLRDIPLESHPFRAHYHGPEDGTDGLLAVESGYVIPSGILPGSSALLPTFYGTALQDQRHTGDLTGVLNPLAGDY